MRGVRPHGRVEEQAEDSLLCQAFPKGHIRLVPREPQGVRHLSGKIPLQSYAGETLRIEASQDFAVHRPS